MAADALDFLPLFPDDDEDAILARMRASANEGLDPANDADQWTDTREGSFWHISVMPAVRELARLYDLAGTEVPASGFPVWAWADYLDDHAEVQDIARLAPTAAEGMEKFTGPNGTVIAVGTTVGVEPAQPDDDAPEFEVTVGGVIAGGIVELPIRAVETGTLGNVAAGAITSPSTPLPPGVTITNDDPTTGGTDPETDEALRERVLDAYQGKGAGNRGDYLRWGRAWEGVGRVTVIPLWNGPGTVKVIVMDADGGPLPAGTVTGLQNDLDPTAGLGDGRAPIGAQVTVTTAVALNITVAATVEPESGFTLDGTGGTVAIRADIEKALSDYIERVPPGGEVVFEQIRGRIAVVNGVHDVGGVTVNGGVVNVPVDDDPAQSPQLTNTAGIVEGAV